MGRSWSVFVSISFKNDLRGKGDDSRLLPNKLRPHLSRPTLKKSPEPFTGGLRDPMSCHFHEDCSRPKQPDFDRLARRPMGGLVVERGENFTRLKISNIRIHCPHCDKFFRQPNLCTAVTCCREPALTKTAAASEIKMCMRMKSVNLRLSLGDSDMTTRTETT